MYSPFHPKPHNRPSFSFPFFFLFVLTFFVAQGQYTGGTNNPNSSAVLDLTSSDKGFLAPRISLTSSSTLAPIIGTASSTHNGLLVFNINPSATNGLEGTGYYYWGGGSTGNWHLLANTADNNSSNLFTADGSLTGARTLSQSNNNLTFNTGIGDFQMGNNNPTLFVDGTTNRVGIGTASPTQSLHISGNARITGALRDANNAVGTAGQVLISTATGTRWVNRVNFVTQAQFNGLVTNTLISGDRYVITDGDNAGRLNIFERLSATATRWYTYAPLPPFQGGLFNGRTYQIINSPMTGRQWLDRNLGAERVAISTTDTQAQGDTYQWGRNTDGHEISTSATTLGPVASGNEGANFITTSSSPHDWVNPSDPSRWNGTSKGAHDPCPRGFRVPTITEWQAELTALGITNETTAFNSILRLPRTAFRRSTSSVLNVNGLNYWTSTVSSGNNSRLFFVSGSTVSSNINLSRASGATVRCINEQ